MMIAIIILLALIPPMLTLILYTTLYSGWKALLNHLDALASIASAVLGTALIVDFKLHHSISIVLLYLWAFTPIFFIAPIHVFQTYVTEHNLKSALVDILKSLIIASILITMVAYEEHALSW